MGSIGKLLDGTWNVRFKPTGKDGSDGLERTINAAIVVLAGGTLGSTELLLRSQGQGLAVSKALDDHEVHDRSRASPRPLTRPRCATATAGYQTDRKSVV